jgi:hypothetical protein
MMTAFDLDAARIARAYNMSKPEKVPLPTIAAMWQATGCSNLFSATAGEQPLWQSQSDGGAQDMYSYCTLTKTRKASPGQRAVCGSVHGNCTLQSLPTEFDPTLRPGHAEYVKWARWMLANFSLNPGTIYSPPVQYYDANGYVYSMFRLSATSGDAAMTWHSVENTGTLPANGVATRVRVSLDRGSIANMEYEGNIARYDDLSLEFACP